MIAVDWGTSSFRAFRLAPDGAVLDRVSESRGIMTVSAGAFPEALRSLIGSWLMDGEDRVLMAGMVGSRQGWIEAPYVVCPASAEEIAASLVRVPFEGARVFLVPGLSDRDPDGAPEVMRGEETQILGVMAADGLACLPGSHSKWARVEGGRIARFTTYLSGEAFAAIRAGTILGRMMPDAPSDPTAFDRGVARAAMPGGLLHHLFGVRTQGLFGELADTSSASYLSGLLIGHELNDAMRAGESVHLIGSASLCALYARAIAARGGTTVIEDEDAAARGLARIGRSAPWT